MIKIEHTFTFPEINGLDNIIPLPEEIGNVLRTCRQEASSRGCLFFTEINTDRTQLISTFIWDNQALVDDFVQWADTEHNYSNVYQQCLDLAELHGGTLTKTITEF